MDKTIRELKQEWEWLLQESLCPLPYSTVENGIHIGMFKIHGHHIDTLTKLIESLEIR